MKKISFKVIAVLTVTFLLFSFMPVSFAYDGGTQIIYSKTFDEYSLNTSKSVAEVEEKANYDEEKAEEDDYFTFRAIVCAENIRSVSFARFSPIKVVFDETGEIAILTFENAKDTKYAVETLNSLDFIEFAEADSIVQIPDDETNPDIFKETENTARERYSWGVAAMGFDVYSKYLSEAGFNNSIVVAVVDTGVEFEHPFLKDRILNNGHDYVSGDNYPSDGHGHGTHVAGTILDCAGDLNIRIMPVRVLGNDGKGSTSNIANGIKYAYTQGAKVINLSLGGGHGYYIDKYVNAAYKNGTVVCCAAGNESENCSNSCPAHIANAITVSAIDENLNFAYFSNYGKGIDVCAPGVNITSSYIGSTYASLEGTSMATPHITAACAMILLNYPEMSPSGIMSALQYIAKDLGTAGFDNYYGYGMPDLLVLFDLHTHSASDWQTVTPPTCINDGVKVKLCKYCGELMDTGVIKSSVEHIFGEWNVSVKPTCQNKGYQTRTCLYCSLTESQELDLTDHDYLKTSVEKTCTLDGYTVYQCKNCSYNYTSDIVPAGHTMTDTVVPATCKEDGYTKHSCQKCDYFYLDTVTLKIPHSLGKWVTVTPATVTKDGLEGQYCSLCKELINSRTVEKIKIVFEKAEGTNVVIDKENKLIYGIEEGRLNIENLFKTDNCTIEIHQTNNGLGTGSTLDVKAMGEVIDTYNILFFGDVSGDGIIDESDIIIINLYISWALSDYNEFENSILFKAGDLTCDGVIDESDLIVFYMVNAWLCEIDQSNPSNILY